jgi:hypothetical protein
MKKDAGIRDREKKIGWKSTYTCGSGRHFGILGCRNALRTDYVKRPSRSVTAEANRSNNLVATISQSLSISTTPIHATAGSCATARHCHSAFSTLLGMRHPRHQLVANATMDEAFLQAGAIRCSSGFGACGRLGFTAALDFLTYSNVLKEVTGPVSLLDA